MRENILPFPKINVNKNVRDFLSKNYCGKRLSFVETENIKEMRDLLKREQDLGKNSQKCDFPDDIS